MDGGFEEDAEDFVRLAERHSEGRPEIPLWLLTHPHKDHYGLLVELAGREDLRSRVKVKSLAMHMPPRSFVDAGRGTAYSDQIDLVHSIAPALGAEELKAAQGKQYRVDDICVDILQTCEDLAYASDPNETSMIFRVSSAGQTFLFTGDTYAAPAKQLAERMGDKLKCDFCQLAHHALNGGADELYGFVRPKIVLVPMARPAFHAMTTGMWAHSEEIAANRRVLQSMPPDRLWLSADGDNIAELPYSFEETAEGR